jgi:hypothetical protein
VPLLNTEPGMDRLRGEPRYQAMVTRLGLPTVERPR